MDEFTVKSARVAYVCVESPDCPMLLLLLERERTRIDRFGSGKEITLPAMYKMPGGLVDERDEDDPKKAALREWREETGTELPVGLIEAAQTVHVPRPPAGRHGETHTEIVFLIVTRGKTGQMCLSSEMAGARWFPLDTLPLWDNDTATVMPRGQRHKLLKVLQAGRNLFALAGVPDGFMERTIQRLREAV